MDDAAEASSLIGRSEAELARIRRLAVERDATAARAIAAARHQAGVLASFDASVEGERARRHEAAAERSFHRALRAIAEHRATLDDLPVPTTAAATPPPAPAASPRQATALVGSFPLAGPGSLGSSRPDGPPPGIDDLFGLPGRRAAVPGTPEARRNRPDLARVVRRPPLIGPDRPFPGSTTPRGPPARAGPARPCRPIAASGGAV